MEQILKDLEQKYCIKIGTIRELIDSSSDETNPFELSKYRAVHRFLKEFKDDIVGLQEYNAILPDD